ncbi:MAG TPA: type II secretion system protein N [Allosphingosinicella sp.]|jgi:general secretion pathway protein C
MSVPAIRIEHEVETSPDEAPGPRPRPLGAAQPEPDTVDTLAVVVAARRRGWERLPRPTFAAVAEFTLLTLLALQCARLAWTLVTPLGPVGAWTMPVPAPLPPAAVGAPLDFDPFFRTAPAAGGAAVVTSLPLTLHGVREDRATGRGSAIIATPDGQQNSIAVGEEIMPGVILSAVGADSVTISRGGVAEQIFLGVGPAGESTSEGASPAPAPQQGPGR